MEANGTLTIPSAVTYNSESYSIVGVERNAFKSYRYLTGDLLLPDTITFIGDGAFQYCVGFSGLLKLPNALVNIGKTAFEECNFANVNLEIPATVTYMGASAFRECTSLSGQLKFLGNTSNGIGKEAFTNCSFTSVHFFKDYVQYKISANAFNMLSLNTVHIANNRYTDIQIEQLLGKICGARIVAENRGTETFTVGGIDYRVIDTGDLLVAATGRSSGTGELVIPKKVTNGSKTYTVAAIAENAFADKTDITGMLQLPSSITTVGDSAFSGCTGLSGIVLPAALYSVGQNAFYGCINALGQVTLPASLRSIGRSAFYSSVASTFVCLGATLPYYAGSTGSIFNKASIVKVPAGTLEGYRAVFSTSVTGNDDNDGNPDNETGPQQPDSTQPGGTPQTGDNSNMGLWVTMLVVSLLGGGLAAWQFIRRRRRATKMGR